MNRIKFEEFTNVVVEKIKEYLPESFANASVELQTVIKNNNLKLTGLMIRAEDSNIAPTIYLESFFEKYKSGEDIKDVLEDIADIRVNNELKEKFDVDLINDFDKAGKRIVPHLIGNEWNKELLKLRPHKFIEDLAITYHILLDNVSNGTASIAVTNELMENWGVDVDELHSTAISNMKRLVPSTFQSMTSILGEMMGADSDELVTSIVPEDEVMFVLSNKNKMFGSAALLDEETMEIVIKKLGKSFYIIMSSVHECIIVVATEDMDVAILKEMVRDVNASTVSLEERLSNNVYIYTKKEGLRIAY